MTIANTKGIVLWFTGLSGAGKSTIAEGLKRALASRGGRVAVLDGDDIRKQKHAHLDFSRDGIRENNRLLALLAKERVKDADVVIVSIISPYREDRRRAREVIGGAFKEVFVDRPLTECIERDEKGLYKKARQGELRNFIGIDPKTPYEPPKAPDLRLDTSRESSEANVEKLLAFVNAL